MRVVSKFFFFWIYFTTVYSYRLPTNVIPEHYKLEILTNFGVPNNFNFDGKVTIDTKCTLPTNNITLHISNLNITEDEISVKDITSGKAESTAVSKIEYDKDNDFLIIQLDKQLEKEHKYEVFIPFHGVLEQGLAGFYRSSYNEAGKKGKKWLGVTQFEAISARKAFPCFDEPAMKATFEIIIGRKEGFSSISNMPLSKTVPQEGKDGWFLDIYEKSVPMSTYLVAYVVSDFGSKMSDPSKKNKVEFKIWARKEALNQVEFARTVGPKALEFYEEFFNVPYPLPKQDMIAIPDFNAGAMENWGLITYREAYLLFDPQSSSTTSQHSVASVIAHELAHQWFGNLVTMKWWTDLWLNEGFATYMAAVAVDHIFPQWNSLEEEAVKNLLSVFSFDALKTSHPVSVPIGHPNEIDEIFDTISYKKGSSLIRMMSLFLGEDVLRQGVSNYLKKHKYKNAAQDDLWNSLTDEAHKHGVLSNNLTVKIIMDTWTVQTGFPIITVTRNYDKNTADVTQQRFLKDELLTKSGDGCWLVPLSYTDQKELDFNTTRPKAWLSCPKEKLTLNDFPDKNTWVLFNINVAGIYKINYDDTNWNLLIDKLKSDSFKEISSLNRVQLIDDASDLAWTGELDYSIFLRLLEYLKQEDQYLPWKAALSNLNSLQRQTKRSAHFGAFKKYVVQILKPIYERLDGLKLKTATETKLDAIKHQVLTVGWACRLGVEDCINQAIEMVNDWQKNPEGENPIPKDLRSVVYCTAVKEGGEPEWEFIWNKYKESNVATEKDTFLRALGCTREVWLLERYLEWSLTEDSGIRRQDSSTVFGAIAGNDMGYYVAKQFLFNNIDRIHKFLGSNSKRLSRYISAISSQIVSENDYKDLQKFVKDKKKYVTEIKQGVEQSLETAGLNVQWQKRHFKSVVDLLKQVTKDKE